jgi:hypothetical protein
MKCSTCDHKIPEEEIYSDFYYCELCKKTSAMRDIDSDIVDETSEEDRKEFLK